MNRQPVRKYESPLRRAQAEETRNRILAAVADVLVASQDGGFTLDDVARAAGVERRTMFRHFASKDVLLEAFWHWINDRIAPAVLPASREDLTAMPKAAFRGFDAQEAIVKASLHTPSGRQMRLRAVPERRRAIAAAARDALPDVSPRDRARFEAVVHALYSAAAWETLKDYCDLDGKTAGDTVAWAIELMVRALQPATQQKTETGDTP